MRFLFIKKCFEQFNGWVFVDSHLKYQNIWAETTILSRNVYSIQISGVEGVIKTNYKLCLNVLSKTKRELLRKNFHP